MPLAVEYLRTLPDDRVGQTLNGIPLSDGQRWLEGFVYYGAVEVDHPGMNVVALASPVGEPTALTWIEEDGEPWELPECGGQLTGVRARTLAGQVYTWRALRPGGGIVQPMCPPEAWLSAVPEPPPAEPDE